MKGLVTLDSFVLLKILGELEQNRQTGTLWFFGQVSEFNDIW